jgi:hypothetical protein
VATTEEAFLVVGPVSPEAVGHYDVVVSNEVGEVWVPPVPLIQLGPMQRVRENGVPGVMMSFRYPASEGVRVSRSETLATWEAVTNGVMTMSPSETQSILEVFLPTGAEGASWLRLEPEAE